MSDEKNDPGAVAAAPLNGEPTPHEEAAPAEPTDAAAAIGDEDQARGALAQEPAEQPAAQERGEDDVGDDAAAEEEPAGGGDASQKDVERVRALFTRAPGETDAAGDFLFARWRKPIAPAVFGVAPKTAETVKAGFERAAKTAGLEIAEEDPELGANLLVFFCEEWRDLKDVPSLDRLIPDLDKLTTLLSVMGANQYRIFQFSEDVGVTLAIVLLRMDEELSSLPPQALALSQGVQTLLVWSDAAFAADGPVTVGRHGRGVVKRWHQRLIEAAYADDAPALSRDPALAEVLAARLDGPKRPRRTSRRGAKGASRSSAKAEAPENDAATPKAAQSAGETT